MSTAIRPNENTLMSCVDDSSTERARSLLLLGTSLLLLHRAYRAAADKAVNHVGMSRSKAYPLVVIGRRGDGLSTGALAEAIGIESPSLARQLEYLVPAGMVERRTDSLARHMTNLYLTPAGEAAREEIEVAQRRRIQEHWPRARRARHRANRSTPRNRTVCPRAEPALGRVKERLTGGLRLPNDETGEFPRASWRPVG